MEYKYYSVIDKDGFYKDFVLVHFSLNETGVVTEQIDSYKLKNGECLIDAQSPGDMIRAWWNGNKWQEAATSEELEAAKLQRQQEF